MSEDPGSFRDNYAECVWIFDLFAYGFDFLDGRFMPSSEQGLDDKWIAEEEEIKHRDVVVAIAKYDGGIPDSLRRYLDVPGDDDELQSLNFCVRLYAAISAIDNSSNSFPSVPLLTIFVLGQNIPIGNASNGLCACERLPRKPSEYAMAGNVIPERYSKGGLGAGMFSQGCAWPFD